jgi:hypothetical protein
MSALPSASRVIAAPDDTISSFSSAALTSAATRGSRPVRASMASQKSRCMPAEAGSAATGSLMISENSMVWRPASGWRALIATNRRSVASTAVSISAASMGSHTNAASATRSRRPAVGSPHP